MNSIKLQNWDNSIPQKSLCFLDNFQVTKQNICFMCFISLHDLAVQPFQPEVTEELAVVLNSEYLAELARRRQTLSVPSGVTW